MERICTCVLCTFDGSRFFFGYPLLSVSLISLSSFPIESLFIRLYTNLSPCVLIGGWSKSLLQGARYCGRPPYDTRFIKLNRNRCFKSIRLSGGTV